MHLLVRPVHFMLSHVSSVLWTSWYSLSAAFTPQVLFISWLNPNQLLYLNPSLSADWCEGNRFPWLLICIESSRLFQLPGSNILCSSHLVPLLPGLQSLHTSAWTKLAVPSLPIHTALHTQCPCADSEGHNLTVACNQVHPHHQGLWWIPGFRIYSASLGQRHF